MQLDLPGLANTSGVLPLFSRLSCSTPIPRNVEPRILARLFPRRKHLGRKPSGTAAEKKKGGLRRPLPAIRRPKPPDSRHLLGDLGHHAGADGT
ncbi:hypothetical protein P6166_05145, partial [Stenotrophomonas sp. HITSZ_GD]|uniref:hypothetical protein n=1 Tax=Stenotrophomonas sp. HITSZ_GD TaxID=3037248 RepID=UPI00240D131B